MLMTEFPKTIYLQSGGDELDAETPFESSETTWCTDRVFDSDVEYRRVDTPTTWHARFITEQREAGTVQPHLLAMIESLLEEAEREYGGELPEPTFELPKKAKCQIRIRWEVERAVVKGKELFIYDNGEVRLYDTLSFFSLLDEFLELTSPTQLAAALRELFEEEGEG